MTDTTWYETFSHGPQTQTWAKVSDPLSGPYEEALRKSATDKEIFRAFPALPDERMKAQEGFFVGSAVPKRHTAPGVMGFNPTGKAPGPARLAKLLSVERGRGRPTSLSFCAIVITAAVKDKIRDPLKHTYNRRRRVLFPDVDGFREGLLRGQLD
ncbi:hypothetical protein ACIA5G_34165 [Amycolatopsis sp. NPDC051758]|uniref:hypothetical protein n=1 Tax=Amycolatopsis sp. NPDC051758 TaxID=3363935 RepID=UPI0037B14A2A